MNNERRLLNIEDIVGKLQEQGYSPYYRRGDRNQAIAYCPVCKDQFNSKGRYPHHFSIVQDGDILKMRCVKCGATNSEIIRELGGYKEVKVSPPISYKSGKVPIYTSYFKAEGNPYIYYNYDGIEVFRKVRGKEYDKKTNELILEKTFRIFGRNGKGRRDPKCGVNIYKLPQLMKTKEDDLIFIVEGEKDVKTLTKLGYNAFTTYHGAKDKIPLDPREEEILKSRTNLVAISDNDEVGELYADFWCKTYKALKIRTKDIWELEFGEECPEHMDITDYLEKEGRIETLIGEIDHKNIELDEEIKNEENKSLKDYILDNLPYEFSYKNIEYKINYDGIYYKNTKTDEYEKIIRNLVFPIEYIKDLETWGQMIRLYSDKAKDGIITLNPNILASKSKIIQWNDKGISITENDNQKAVGYFAGFLNEFEDRIKTVWSTDKVKFIENKLVGFNSPVELGDKLLQEVITPRGDFKSYIDKVYKRVWGKYGEIEFIISFALASVINGLIKDAPLILMLCGKSGNGKTPATKIANSVIGNFENLIFPSRSTLASLRDRYIARHCIPATLEDLEQMRKNFQSENERFIYEIAAGEFYLKKEKDKNSPKGWKVGAPAKFYNFTITSAEKQLLNEYARQGAVNRIVLLKFPKIDGNFFAKIIPECLKNYGWIINDFLDNAPLELITDITNYGNDLDLKGIDDKYISCYKSMIFILKWLNKRYGKVGEWTAEEYKEIFLESGASTKIEEEETGTIDYIKNFINKNDGSFYRVYMEKDGRGAPIFKGIKGYQVFDPQDAENKTPAKRYGGNYGYLLYSNELGTELLERVIKIEEVEKALNYKNTNFKNERQDWADKGYLRIKKKKQVKKGKEYPQIIYSWEERIVGGEKAKVCHFIYNTGAIKEDIDVDNKELQELKKRLQEKDETIKALMKQNILLQMQLKELNKNKVG